MKPTGPTDTNLKNLIKEMKKSKDRTYLVLARHLEKPRRKKNGVNLSKIDRIAKQNDNVAVPGKVLASGEIKKPVNVYAWVFSKNAKEKIAKSGGKCLSIADLVKNKAKARVVI
jgi:large subunit ribosomal protein L18e